MCVCINIYRYIYMIEIYFYSEILFKKKKLNEKSKSVDLSWVPKDW